MAETDLDKPDAPDWENYESGPFCRHWSDPGDCDRACATCGHRCVEHWFGEGLAPECHEYGCDCEKWTEAEVQE